MILTGLNLHTETVFTTQTVFDDDDDGVKHLYTYLKSVPFNVTPNSIQNSCRFPSRVVSEYVLKLQHKCCLQPTRKTSPSSVHVQTD